MSEHVKALFIILFLATVTLAVAQKPASAEASEIEDFKRRRNLWLFITVSAFLAFDFWIYSALAAAAIAFSNAKERNKLAMFFFVLFAVPPFNKDVGVGGINLLFQLNYLRLLELTILLPAALSLMKQPNRRQVGFSVSLPDKFVAMFIILHISLIASVNSITGIMREGILYSITDMILPYYVASRSLKNLADFRDALMSFLIAGLIISAIGMFEFTRHWLLYSTLPSALGVTWGLGGYLNRGNLLRAQATTGQAIPLGYAITVAIGFALYLWKLIPGSGKRLLCIAVLAGGLISPLSRGPWIGAAVMILVFIVTGPNPGKTLVQLAVVAVVAVPLLMVTPVGPKLIDYLPFVGTVETDNVTFRQRLLEISIEVIKQNPYFGTFDFLNQPAFTELKTGTGLLDIVNTYVAIGLSYGLVGLTLFSSFFISVCVSIVIQMSKVGRDDEEYLLGRALLSALIGIMITIFTVSSITIIPVIYWTVGGLGVAYSTMLGSGTARIAASGRSTSRFSRQTGRYRSV